MPAPFHKGAYWCSTSAPLVKGGTPPKAEGGFRPTAPLASPLGGGAPAGGGEGPHPPSCHCEEGQSPDAAIRPPPSQSAPLPAPPQGEPRPGPRTPTILASPLGGGAPAGGGEGPHPPSCHCEKAQRADVAIRTSVPSSSNFLQIFSFSGLTNSPYSFTISTRKQDGGIQPRPWSDPLPCFRTVYNQTSTGNPRVLRPGVFLFFMPFHGKTCISSWLQLSSASSRAAQEENCSSSSAQVRKR